MNNTFHSFSRKKGGLKSISLIDTSQILDYEYDKVNNVIVSLVLEDNSEFCNICYNEASAYYLETVKIDKGSPRVKHELFFSISESNEQTDKIISKIAVGAIKTVVALVVDNNGRKFLIGFTPYFKGERALQLNTCLSDTALELSSKPLSFITLVSEDTSSALGIL